MFDVPQDYLKLHFENPLKSNICIESKSQDLTKKLIKKFQVTKLDRMSSGQSSRRDYLVGHSSIHTQDVEKRDKLLKLK